MANAKELTAKARDAFNSGMTKPYEFRIKQLKALLRLIEENEDQLSKAIIEDTRKTQFEAVLYEVEFVKNSVKHMIYNLKEWMEPIKAEKPLPFLFDKVSNCKISRECSSAMVTKECFALLLGRDL